jgi:hypothetical protein
MSVAAPQPEVAPDESFRSVLAAFAANAMIALAKGVAAVFTGSPALLAETLHTVADAGNEVLLFVAIRRSRHPADASAPSRSGTASARSSTRPSWRRSGSASRCSSSRSCSTG